MFTSKVEEACDNAMPTDENTGQQANPLLHRWHCHMHQFFCRIYVNMRIEELFSIIRGEVLGALLKVILAMWFYDK